ncbi:MAG: cysteine desulfurase [Bdellovibrionales bacterium]|nr:cysteine desulfurase [Bdellovibrionales bacterium]
MKKDIYLDYHATTPVLPVVAEAMAPYLREHFGNANSNHKWGWKAEMAVSKASRQVADLVGCEPSQVYFTSGATESIHWAIIGWADQNPGGTIITTATEHKATYGACEWAEKLGCKIIIVPVDEFGFVQIDAIKKELGKGPALVSVIHGNNEIGTINPIGDIAKLVHSYPNSFVHVDCAQSVGKIEVDFKAMDLDYLSFSGHKLYAPKGVGGLLVKDPESLSPLFIGGGQQRGLRAGTINVPSVVGLGAACQWCNQHLDAEKARLSQLRDSMIERLLTTDQVLLNGHLQQRLPYNISLTFETTTMDKLLLKLNNIAFSSSSACASKKPEPSHVLMAIGRSPEQASRTLRFGLGHDTTTEEVEIVCSLLIELLAEADPFARP